MPESEIYMLPSLLFVFEYGTKRDVSLQILMLHKDVKLGRASSWRKLSALYTIYWNTRSILVNA